MIVGICDDDRNWCRRAEQIILDFAKRQGEEIKPVMFNNGNELLGYEGLPMDVLFLDIEMNDINGISLAERVNKRWSRCRIVYLTNYLYYATEVYHTEHSYFVLKKQLEEKIGDIFGKVEHELQQGQKRLIFQLLGKGTVNLAPEEILYFERKLRQTEIVTMWGQYQVRDKLADIEERISKLDFVKCHNSFIVYLPTVRELRNDVLVLRNGERVMISRTYAKCTREAFARWAMTQV